MPGLKGSIITTAEQDIKMFKTTSVKGGRAEFAFKSTKKKLEDLGWAQSDWDQGVSQGDTYVNNAITYQKDNYIAMLYMDFGPTKDYNRFSISFKLIQESKSENLPTLLELYSNK